MKHKKRYKQLTDLRDLTIGKEYYILSAGKYQKKVVRSRLGQSETKQEYDDYKEFLRRMVRSGVVYVEMY